MQKSPLPLPRGSPTPRSVSPSARRSAPASSLSPARRRTPTGTPTTAAAVGSSPPPPPLPPRQGLVYGPLTTASITTVVHESPRRGSALRATPEKLHAPPSPSLQYRLGSPRTGTDSRRSSRGRVRSHTSAASTLTSPSSSSPQRHTTLTQEEMRELRQTRSLFLCGRGLLSLRHIQHLPEMLSLRFLSVHMNAIKTLEAGCLRTLRHLVELDLSANEVQELPMGCWSGLDKLERLNLSSNLLTQLGTSAFKGLHSLQWLSLGFNSLTDIRGLCSIPPSAPLTYVDLCANRIQTVEEITEALTGHRAALQELRVESPSWTQRLLPHDGVDAPLNTSSTSTLSYWQVQENPFCCHHRNDSDSHRNGDATPLPLADVHDLPPPYVQQLLSFFPRLLVVNGTSYGVDPLELLRPEDGTGGEAEGAATVDGDHSGAVLASDEASRRQREEAVAAADSFALLLAKPLPRLPDLPSSSSSSSSRHSPPRQPSPAPSSISTHTSAPSTASTPSQAHLGPDAQHGRQRSSRSSSRQRQRDSTDREAPSSPPMAQETKAQHTASVEPDQRVYVDHDHRAPSKLHADATHVVSPLDSAAQPGRRRRSAPKPRRAALRCRPSSTGASPLSSAAASSSSSAVSPQSATEKDAKGAADESSPHARQLRFEGAVTPHVALRDASRGGVTATASGAARQEGGERQRSSSRTTDVRGGDDHSRKTSGGGSMRRGGASMPGNSPAGITDGSDLSASRADDQHRQQQQQRPHNSNSSSNSIPVYDVCYAVNMSSGGTRTPRDGGGHTSSGENSPQSCRKNYDGFHSPAAQTPPRAYRAATGEMAKAALPWRPKQVSRGTCTEWRGDTAAIDAAAAAAQLDALRAEADARVTHLQEQLSLRTTTIADLRRHLDLTRSQYVESQRDGQQQQQQLRSQVAALKDELSRRSAEATILQRKQQAQLNKAVESVRAEWSRRMAECEQRHAARREEEELAWQTQRSALSEEKTQLQQTCHVRSAQLAALERQTQAMEAELAALRQRAVRERQTLTAQSTLWTGEAEARRCLETEAWVSALHLRAWQTQQQAHLDASRVAAATWEAEEARAELRARRAEWAAQSAEYDAALRHAAQQLESLRRNPRTGVDEASSAGAREETGAADEPLSSPPPEGVLLLTYTTDTPSATADVADDGSAQHSTGPLSPPPTTATEAQPHPPSVDSSVSAYWRDAHARTEAQRRRVEAALQVATATQRSLAAENTRLLQRVDGLEKEAAALRDDSSRARETAAQESANLLRTLHTLRADMEKKDGALDELEAEARSKLGEKRRRIAELEEAVEALTAQQATATELSASYRSQLEAAQQTVAELRDALEQERRERHAAEAAQQQQLKVPEVERKARELAELLATRTAQVHQQELEKAALVRALTAAREQLVRLQESNTYLAQSVAAAREQQARQQAEVEAAQRQLRDVQEASRAKQRATREALSQLMASDSV